jgi:hypothetical protein
LNFEKLLGIEPYKSLTRIIFLLTNTVADSNLAVPIAITGPIINMEIRNNTFTNSNVSMQNNSKTKIDDNYEA